MRHRRIALPALLQALSRRPPERRKVCAACRWSGTLLLIVSAALAITGCWQQESASQPPAKPLFQRRTTTGAIALRNLNAEVDVLQRDTRNSPRDTRPIRPLVEALLTRALVLGRLEDYFRAEQLAEAWVKVEPANGGAFRLRARVHIALHRFDRAEADLDAAGRLGSSPQDLLPLRAKIEEMTGHLDAALALRERASADRPDTFNLAAEAALLGKKGNIAAADERFDAALARYGDVSPFPFAWIHFQQGLMWEAADKDERAATYFREALRRLPGHAPSISHLAALRAKAGRLAEAINLLRGLTKVSDNPEYGGQLAPLLRETGNTAQAERLIRETAEQFDRLVKSYPDAFAAKAAQFWLTTGQDPAKALPLAERNFRIRQRYEDKQLLAWAKQAALKTSAR